MIKEWFDYLNEAKINNNKYIEKLNKLSRLKHEED